MKYELMTWPESQFFAHLDGVYFCADENVWFVPENMIEREDIWEDYYGEIGDLEDAKG